MARRSGRFARLGAVLACAASLLLVQVPQASALTNVRAGEWALDYFHVDQVWAISKGTGVTVAIVDSGVDPSTTDLAGQFVPGGSVVGGPSNGLADADGHGTNMAGIIAGTGANGGGRGMYGLAPGAKIMPVRAETGDDATDASVGAAIRFAADSSAKIINVSLGLADHSPDTEAATDYALSKGKLVVAGAGNDGSPARLDPSGVPGVLAVSATDQNSQPWTRNEFGPQIVLAAPGVDIYTNDLDNEYGDATGTSCSAAFVSAAAALVWSKYPGLTAAQVIRQLITTADQKGTPPRNDDYGYGIVDPLKALTTPPDTTDTANPLITPTVQPTYTYTLPTPSLGPVMEPGVSDTPSAPGAAAAAGSGTSSGGLLIAVIAVIAAVAVLTAAVVTGRRRRRNATAGAGPATPVHWRPDDPGPPDGGPPPGRL